MKKALSFLLMVISLLLTTSAFAANTRTSGLYTYEIKGNGTLTITKFNWAANNGDVFIPNMLDGYTVTAIGDEAFYCEEQLNQRVSVTIPDSIKSIGEKAFWNTNIIGINIPNNVQLIGYGAFAGCPECQFKLSPSQNYFACIDNCLYNKSKKELIACSWRNEVDWGDNYLEGEIKILDGIKSIGDYALSALGNIRGIAQYSKFQNVELYIPSSVEKIGDYAIAWSSIYRLNGSISGVKSIGCSAFEETSICGSGYNNTIYSFYSLETIGSKALSGLTLTGAVFDFSHSSLSTIPDALYFSYNDDFIWDVKKIETIGIDNWGIGDHYTSPDDFSPNLTYIPSGLDPQVSELPETVKRIDSFAFGVVTDFTLSSALTHIATDAFQKGSSFIVEAGSYAELWCSENGYSYTIEGGNNLDWLNN